MTSIEQIEVTVADDESIEVLGLSDLLEDGPILLAFFPAAYTSTCMTELTTFRDDYPAGIAGHSVYGVSVDSPFVLQQVKDEYDLPYRLISDFNRALIEHFDIAIDFDKFGLEGLAQRAVFAIDQTGNVTYEWIAEDPGQLPPLDEMEDVLSNP